MSCIWYSDRWLPKYWPLWRSRIVVFWARMVARTNLILFLTLLSLLRNFGVRLSHVISGGISFLVFLSCFRDWCGRKNKNNLAKRRVFELPPVVCPVKEMEEVLNTRSYRMSLAGSLARYVPRDGQCMTRLDNSYWPAGAI